MATEEMKSETKRTEHKQKQSTPLPPTIPPLPLPYKVSFLVPLHAHNYNIVSTNFTYYFFLILFDSKF